MREMRLRCLGWSIPAHAGEPWSAWGLWYSPRVYPRPRGGTGRIRCDRRPDRGLSPPTRGNPSIGSQRSEAGRSIPAHAGEPVLHSRAYAMFAVYPRPRGGTQKKTAARLGRRGLSPPTRGNRYLPKPKRR